MLNGLLIVQLLLFCLIFTLIVKVAVIGGAVNGLYFYPKEVQDRVIENGLITREAVERRRKIFMTAFYVVMLVALVLIVRVWNHVTDYWTAYLQSVIFLEVMNWYDGFIIDEIWVRFSKFWVIPGLEDMDYVQSWTQMFRKRLVLTAIWLVGAAIIAALVVGIRSAVC